MKYCTHCGFPLPEGSRFCPGCGLSLEELEATETIQPAREPGEAEPAVSLEETDTETLLVPETENTEIPDSTRQNTDEDPELITPSRSGQPQETAASLEETDSEGLPDFDSAPVSEEIIQTPVSPITDPLEDQPYHEEKPEKGIRGWLHRYQEIPEDLDYDEDEEDYEDDSGGFKGGFLIGAGLCTALLLCLSLAFLNGWIRLPSHVEEESSSQVAAGSSQETVLEPTEPEEPESAAKTFKEAFKKNNTTAAAEEGDDEKTPAGIKSGESYTPLMGMNLRASPSPDSRKTGAIPAGVPVTVLETVKGTTSGTWGKIGENKYVCLSDGGTDYLVPSDEYTPPAVQEEETGEEDEDSLYSVDEEGDDEKSVHKPDKEKGKNKKDD